MRTKVKKSKKHTHLKYPPDNIAVMPVVKVPSSSHFLSFLSFLSFFDVLQQLN